jgi:hypothetical protein
MPQALTSEEILQLNNLPAFPPKNEFLLGDFLADLATAPFNPQSGSYILALSDQGQIIEISDASPNNLTVPADSAVNFPVGTQIAILQVGVGQVTIAPAVGVTVNSRTGLNLFGQWSVATLLKRGANLWVAFGDLAP